MNENLVMCMIRKSDKTVKRFYANEKNAESFSCKKLYKMVENENHEKNPVPLNLWIPLNQTK